MTKKIVKQTKRFRLAVGLVLLAVFISLGGCNKNGANSNTANSTTPSPGTIVKNSLGMEFAYIPAGNFQMGSSEDKKGTPVHQVTFANAFYMGRYEVTEAQWQKIMGKAPEFERGCGENCPVDGVSWNDTQEFVKKLNAANDGYTYHLPSEAEWEYAARAGTPGDNSGDADSIAWFDKNSDGKQHPAGQKKPNAWGLFDMFGNTQEWMADYYHFYYNGAPTDGSAWATMEDKQDFRTLRGGSYKSSVDFLNRREQSKPDSKVLGTGFRVVAVSQLK